MHKNISGTIFYSLLFAMGGAPTIAMLIIQAQTKDPNIIYGVFISLTVIIACILVPLILIQNAFLQSVKSDLPYFDPWPPPKDISSFKFCGLLK